MASSKYSPALIKKLSCAISELGPQKSALDLNIQELEHIITLLQKDLPTGGNAFKYWTNRLITKLETEWQQQQKAVQHALEQLENETNWTKALKRSLPLTNTKPNI